MGLTDLATVTASTKRSPAIVSGKRSTPTTSIASLSITPLDPVSVETMQRMSLGTPVNFYECYAAGGLDIRAGDVLTVSGTDYPIRAVGEWEWPNRGTQEHYTHLVVEKVNP